MANKGGFSNTTIGDKQGVYPVFKIRLEPFGLGFAIRKVFALDRITIYKSVVHKNLHLQYTLFSVGTQDCAPKSTQNCGPQGCVPEGRPHFAQIGLKSVPNQPFMLLRHK